MLRKVGITKSYKGGRGGEMGLGTTPHRIQCARTTTPPPGALRTFNTRPCQLATNTKQPKSA